MSSKVSERKVAQQLFDQLARRVISGGYQPGDQLPSQRTLAQELGCTLTALREALKRLQQLGLIEVNHGEAMRVTDPWQSGGLDLIPYLLLYSDSIDIKLINYVFEVRTGLLQQAAQLAAQRSNEQQQQQLNQLAQRLVDAEDQLTVQLLDLEFFSLLIEAAANPVFSLIMNSIRDAYLANAERIPLGRTPDSVADSYRLIAEAVAAGDSQAAGTAAHQLSTTQAEMLKEVLSGEAE